LVLGLVVYQVGFSSQMLGTAYFVCSVWGNKWR